MSDEAEQPPAATKRGDVARPKAATRMEREAAALRANLAKRKQQTRAREAIDTDRSPPNEDPKT
jgi:hypothetical protein